MARSIYSNRHLVHLQTDWAYVACRKGRPIDTSRLQVSRRPMEVTCPSCKRAMPHYDWARYEAHKSGNRTRTRSTHGNVQRGGGKVRWYEVYTDRLGPTAVAYDYKGASVNVINGGRDHTEADVRRAARKAWPDAPERKRAR